MFTAAIPRFEPREGLRRFVPAGAGMSIDHQEKIYHLPARPMLAFTDGAFEQLFISYYAEFYYRYAQVNIGIGLILIFGDFIADVLVFPGVPANLIQLQFCMPLLAIGLAVSFTAYVRSHWQFIMSGFLIAVAFCLVWALYMTDIQGGMGLKSWIGISTFIFVELYCFVVVGLQFRYALFTGTLVMLAFEAAMFASFGGQLRIFMYLSYCILALFGLACFLGWWREFVLRKDFSARRALEVARRTAEELARVKSDFLATMSHEIRTPMNAIIGMSRLALQTGLDPKQRNYIEKVSRSAEHLLGLINQVLDFSKAEAGKLEMEAASFSLDDVLANLANLITGKAEEKGLDLLFDFANDIPLFLVGDALRLGQVLVNLAGNATKFTERGEVIIGARQVSQGAKEVELHFWVKDSGIGMTADQQSRLFQSYAQADASIAGTYGGTGLGLAISKKLVEMMGGRIWIESEIGQGSSVNFTARFGLSTAPMSRRVICPEDLVAKRLLVVDDNAAAREILVAMARSFGLQADSAWDARQALASVESSDTAGQPYDLVLVDWRMPSMDGIECSRLMQIAELSKPPAIIMVTAECSREGVLTAAKENNTLLKAVLSKPISASTLLEALNEAMGGTGAPAISQVQPAARRTGAMRKLRGARLLLVEDNALNQELAGELLAQAGIVTVIANHGREALDILARDNCFDGILMDCQMPVMDGFAATREIRRNPAFGAMPIIAMTANAMAGDREKVIAAGMADHIAKPFDVDQMFETMAAWITPAHPAAAGPDADVASAPLVFELPGVDTRAGLAITMNNEELYLNLLRQFHAAEANFAGAFRLAQQGEDVSAASRSAHTLRGSAGNIGAKDVQEAAAALEHACTKGAVAEVIEEKLAATLAALRPVIEGLAALERRKTYPLLASGLGKKMVGPLLARLIALLEDNNLEAGDVVQELAACVENTGLAEVVAEAAEAVSCFDVDLALSILRIMATKIERE